MIRARLPMILLTVALASGCAHERRDARRAEPTTGGDTFFMGSGRVTLDRQRKEKARRDVVAGMFRMPDTTQRAMPGTARPGVDDVCRSCLASTRIHWLLSGVGPR